jgi:hypothetical protein
MLQPVKKYFSCFVFAALMSLALQQAVAQHLTKKESKDLEKREDSLRKFADAIVLAPESAERFRSDSQFIRMLVRTLKQKNSFYYAFDSLQTISRLYAPDSSFRIFTWQLKKDEYVYHQQGAIQMNMPDGSLKLFGLHDASMFSKNPLDSIRTPNNWIGAIYYRIVLKTYNGKKYYTLLGFDDFSVSSSKKWMEVLTFDPNGLPVFGGPYISFKDDTTRKPILARFNIEYKKEASVTFNYDAELDMILFDNLMPEDNEPKRKETYIPDGDFEGFKWKDGQWVHVDKIFDFKLKDGAFPQEKNILDNNGAPDEQKLQEQSLKNQQKKPKATKPVKKDG